MSKKVFSGFSWLDRVIEDAGITMDKIDHTKFNHYEGIVIAHQTLYDAKENIEGVLNGRYTPLTDDDRKLLKSAQDDLRELISIFNKKRILYRNEFSAD